jgi:hypothetical protein
MVVLVCANAMEPAHTVGSAVVAAIKTERTGGKIESRFVSMRNLLDRSSVAQRLDGTAV